jgi:hypothetical protein
MRVFQMLGDQSYAMKLADVHLEISILAVQHHRCVILLPGETSSHSQTDAVPTYTFEGMLIQGTTRRCGVVRRL